MDIIDRISELCRQNGTTVTKLEKELGYSNGSLAKAKDIPSSRIYTIAKKFHVSMEYIIDGITVEIKKIDTDFIADLTMEKRLMEYAKKLYELNEKNKETIYNNIDFLTKKEGRD